LAPADFQARLHGNGKRNETKICQEITALSFFQEAGRCKTTLVAVGA
jgi:hypothetical protein